MPLTLYIEKTMQDKILFVIVLYCTKLYDTKTYKSLILHNPEVQLYIYDNSPTPLHNQNEFESNVKYVSDISNPGVSRANNCAANYAKSMGMEWMLLLDQDTFFAPDILDEYIESVKENPGIKMFVPPMAVGGGLYMSPVKVRFHCARLAKSVPQGILSLKKYASINSGQLINVDAFHEVGGYNENVPLDFCEFQFHRRLLSKYNTFFVMKTPCLQEFSDQVQHAEQKLRRFEIFCQCLKNCEKDGFFDRLAYCYVVFKRALSLVFFSRNLKPLKVFFVTYLS